MTTAELLIDQLERTREWTLKLMADFDGREWTFQPAAGAAQHALWLCGHLAVAADLLLFQRCLGKAVLDPQFSASFPIGAPVKAASEFDWPDPGATKRYMDEMHRMTIETVRTLSDDWFSRPAAGKDGAPHPHYDNRLGALSHLARHEAFHAGQLALIRRLLGKPFLR